jgi:hypothetical protein
MVVGAALVTVLPDIRTKKVNFLIWVDEFIVKTLGDYAIHLAWVVESRK